TVISKCKYIIVCYIIHIGVSLHVKDHDIKVITPLDDIGQTLVTIRPPKSEELLTSSLITEEPTEEELAEGEEAEEGETVEGETEEGEEEETEGEEDVERRVGKERGTT